MNLLIIGGLLALAVVAILGAVLLGMSEDRAEKAKREEPEALPMQALPTPQVPEAPLVPEMATPAPVESQMTSPLAPELPTQTPMTPQIAATPAKMLPRIAATPSAVVFPPTASAPAAAPLPEAAPIGATSEAAQGPETTPPSLLPVTRQVTGPLVPSSREGLLTAYRNGHLPAPREDEHLAIRKSQIREIVGELRSLAQKANELELRLSSLEEALDGQQSYQDEATAKHRALRPDHPSV